MTQIKSNYEESDKHYYLKEEGLESVLGKMHNVVGHAIIPFSVGGLVDMYYFLDHLKGTCFATMELIDLDGSGPMANEFGTYELIGFTKENYNKREGEKTNFNLIERRFCGIFTTIGVYSKQTVLKPGDTCEIPRDNGNNICLIFDRYIPDGKEFLIGNTKHHLLLCIEIFKTEMEFAMQNGSSELFNKLKLADYYPYSDMDRKPVA